MANYFKDLTTRVIVDWKEWTTFQKLSWIERYKQLRAQRDIIREKRMIDAAIERAKIKSARDHRTYYIMRDKWGGINEMNRYELDTFIRGKIFPRMNYLKRLDASIAIVTENKMVQQNFDAVQANKLKQKKDE